jgi:hypothetical protein
MKSQTRPRWVLGVAGAYSRTSLRFGDGLRAGQSRNALVAVGAYSLTPKLSLRASAGVAFAGELRAPNGVHGFDPGPTLAIGADYRVLSGKPFLLLSALVSATTARTHLGTESARYSAFDLRLGAALGVQLFEMLSPYALVRVFEGRRFGVTRAPHAWARTYTTTKWVRGSRGSSRSVWTYRSKVFR